MKKFLLPLCLTLFAVSCRFSTPAPHIELPILFSDHMVLQRDANIKVWGKATPHAAVSVSFKNQQAEIIAGEDSTWLITLAPEPAGGPYEFTVSGEESITFTDVLVGEVWLASGQSNMEWPLRATNDAEAAIAAANDTQMRLFTVQKSFAGMPRTDIPGEGWVLTSPETVAGFSAVAYYFGNTLRDSLDVPVGLIHSSWGGTPAEAWTSATSLAEHPDYAETVEAMLATSADQVDPDSVQLPAQSGRQQHQPTVLYNAMIHPLAPYAIRGAIWYQGESNASRAHQYQTLFPMMIEDWRSKWNSPINFHFVQLANFMEAQSNPVEEETWPELREAQTMALSLPQTGMAVTIDIGEADDIHPRNKKDVGFRLAMSALGTTYERPVVPAGPLYEDFAIEDNKVRISFQHTPEGLKTSDNGPVKGFAIAGEDRVFHWGNAVIEGNEIVVSSPQVATPVAVRYGWANNPDLNLYNLEGLPASPFRTDNWPGITENAR